MVKASPAQKAQDKLKRTLSRAKAKNGRNSRNSTMVDGRQYAIGVEGTVITFECKREGHTYKIDFAKKPLARRLDAAGAKFHARWWSKDRGGCIGSCPKCERKAKAEAKAKAEPKAGGLVAFAQDVEAATREYDGRYDRPIKIF